MLVLPGLILAAGVLAFVSQDGAVDGDALSLRFREADYISAQQPEDRGPDPRSTEIANTDLASASTREIPFNPSPLSAGQAQLAAGEYRVTIVDEDNLPVGQMEVTVIERPNFSIPNSASNEKLLNHISVQTLKTDENGQLTYLASAGSKCDFRVQKQGYADKHYRLVDPGVKTIRLRRFASVAGTVRDEYGLPVSGVEVELYHDQTHRRELARTNSSGGYRFDKVTPNKVYLRIAVPEFERAAQTLLIVEGRTQFFQDFYLKRGRQLRLGVFGPEGRPMADLDVRLRELNSGQDVGIGQTDGQGRVEFHCLRPNLRYMAEAKTGNGLRGLVVFQVKDDDLAIARRIDLRGTLTLYGQINAGPGIPLAHARIVIESEAVADFNSSKQREVVETDENGRFVVNGLDSDLAYNAVVFHPQFAIKVISSLNTTGNNSVSSPLNIDLDAPSSLGGRVLGPDQNPLADALVYVNLPGSESGLVGSRVEVRTDSNGEYYFGNLPGGLLTLGAIDPLSSASVAIPSIELQQGGHLEYPINTSDQ